jgi:branched-subunit amino acid aminotransferase/4-amino-4-deoxychorismate lyase
VETVAGGVPAIPATHRGFLYADGLFETIRCLDGQALHLHLHYQRLTLGLKAYKIEMPEAWTESKIHEDIKALLRANQLLDGARVRLTATRRSPGYYTPAENGLDVVMEAKPLVRRLFKLNEAGLNVDVFPHMNLTPDKLSGFKNLASTLFVQSGLYAKAQGLDEALIQNDNLHFIESTSSNIFLVAGGVLYTPGLDTGATAGVMRTVVINTAIELGLRVYECRISNQNMMAADEVFLTNAITGIRWVVGYRSKRYYNTTATRLLEHVSAGAEAQLLAKT